MHSYHTEDRQRTLIPKYSNRHTNFANSTKDHLAHNKDYQTNPVLNVHSHHRKIAKNKNN